MTPSLYDLLDVDPDAGADEIRAAWRTAIAHLDPSDRRFRAYNQAAETLLDPARRQEYDESRSAGSDVSAATTETPTVAAAPVEPPVAEPTRRPRLQKKARVAGERTQPRSEPIDAGDGGDSDAEETARTPGRAVSRTMLLVVGVVTLVLLAGAAFYSWRAADAAADQDRIEATEQAAEEARAAAAKAAVPILSYDYRTLQSDIARAVPFMTSEWASEYESTMQDLRPGLRKQKLAVEAEVVETGVVRIGDDRAQVLVFVDQATSRKGRESSLLGVWVTMTLVEEDGQWLVDELDLDEQQS